jgi:chaperonin GroEL
VVTKTIEFLEKNKKACTTIEDLYKIALVSTNNDKELSEKISEAVFKAGKYGMVLHQPVFEENHSIEYQDGYQLDIGVYYKAFYNKENYMEALNPYILVTDKKITDAMLLTKVIDQVVQHNKTITKTRPYFLIVSPVIGDEVMKVMQKNLERDVVFFCHIPISQDMSPDKNRNILEDICAITGARFISEESGIHVKEIEIQHLGRCEKVASRFEKTLFQGYDPAYNDRIIQLENEIKETKDEYKKQLSNESLAKLTGGMAIIKVGGKNITEQGEIIDRVDDAIKACKSSLEMGYVRGGGIALVEASLDNIMQERDPSELCQLINSILQSPYKRILLNYGHDKDNIDKLTLEMVGKEEFGYDIKNMLSCDMYDIGVIDPVKVIIYALKNSSSVAISMLRTSVMIVKD